MFFGQINHLIHIFLKVRKEQFVLGCQRCLIARVLRVSEKFPVTFAHSPARVVTSSNLPVQNLVRCEGVFVLDHVREAQAVDVLALQRHAGQFREGGEPVAAVADLIAHGAFGQFARPADDRGNT